MAEPAAGTVGPGRALGRRRLHGGPPDRSTKASARRRNAGSQKRSQCESSPSSTWEIPCGDDGPTATRVASTTGTARRLRGFVPFVLFVSPSIHPPGRLALGRPEAALETKSAKSRRPGARSCIACARIEIRRNEPNSGGTLRHSAENEPNSKQSHGPARTVPTPRNNIGTKQAPVKRRRHEAINEQGRNASRQGPDPRIMGSGLALTHSGDHGHAQRAGPLGPRRTPGRRRR
jgi:hypothetical protein